MPTQDIASFQVKRLQLLDEQGALLPEATPPAIEADKLRELFRMMVLTREFDRKAVNLQRQGRIGTYAPVEGQEACQIGTAALLKSEDWVFPAFREQGVFLMRGISMRYIFLYFMGCEAGNQVAPDNNTFPISVAVGSQLPIAVGCAMGLKLQKKPGVIFTYFSDGATSEGDFAEALNFATVYHVPVIFICQNNQWAISTPRQRQTAATTLAQKAIAYQMPTLQVDGNDLLAVYQATQDAVEQARQTGSPYFLELITYRRRMHTTADDPKKYQDADVHEKWLKNDPVKRYKNYLLAQKVIEEGFEAKIIAEAESLIKVEFEAAEVLLKEEKIENIFQYTYASMPEHLKEQLQEKLSRGTSHA